MKTLSSAFTAIASLVGTGGALAQGQMMQGSMRGVGWMGGDGALEVLIFPPKMKGMGEGSYGWDLKPNSSMTNATVADAVKSVNGSVVTVNYHGQEKKISIQHDTPVVTLAPATTEDLKPGAVVFVPGEKSNSGAITSGQVIVGKNGVVPPM